MEDKKDNIFDWASEQMKNEVHSNKYYKGPICNHRYDYNLLCLEILAQAIKEYPNWTFRQIIANFGLLDGNLNEEPDATLGRLRTYKSQYEETIGRWEKLGLTDGLKGEVNETVAHLYEYKP